MVMKQTFSKKTITINCLIALMVAFSFFAMAYFLTDSSLSSVRLSNSFAIGGAMDLVTALLYWISSLGTFDIVSYGLMIFWGYLFRRSYRDKYGTYYDYSQEKKAERTRYKAKRKALLIPYVTIGIVFLIVGLILAFFRF